MIFLFVRCFCGSPSPLCERTRWACGTKLHSQVSIRGEEMRLLPLEQGGSEDFGVPVGQPEHVRHFFLSLKSLEHETLFERIPQVGHTGGLVAPVDVRVTKSNVLVSEC